jgi:lysophospholipase L1-like esterase
MTARPLRLLPVLLLAAGICSCTTPPPATPAAPVAPAVKRVDASAPMPKRGNARFYELHASFLRRAAAGPIGVLFLGDSITEGWGKAPEVWQEYYGPYQPANFGISGDHTEHVLWRLEDGELDGIHPRVVVLMIGTNNSGENTGAEIAAANRKIIALIRTRLPETKVLLLAIFPRGPRKNSNGTADSGVERMAVIAAANAELASLEDGKYVRFLDLGPRFLGPDGKIPDAIMPDQLHPGAAGYKIWADAMQPLLAEMLR